MSVSIRTLDDHPEPRLAGDAETASAPLRFPTEARRGEGARPFTAGERLAVASTLTGGDRVAARRGMLHPALIAAIGLFAAVGAVTVAAKLATLLGWPLL